ncbi:ATP-binding protein [Streptomyces sp. NPDC051109]|uniref:ATP-binding protein n=1 Tax=Streptomyces sp. NPDC051109 TaxID=3365642 RepID=UPI003799038E
MDTLSLDIAAARSTASIADARAILDRLVRPIGAEAAGTVVLVAFELVTNALRHAGGTCTLDLTAHPTRAASRSPFTTPARRRTAHAAPPDLNGGTGDFSRPMVNRLACTTQVIDAPCGGKTVRAFLAW